MEGRKRREQLIQIMKNKGGPVSGASLAQQLGVSRQVIVQDIALLRAASVDIISTNRGYLLYGKNALLRRDYLVKHDTSQIEDELGTIVDHGGHILDVLVHHAIYGDITTPLNIHTREDVRHFVNRVEEHRIVPLKDLTGGIHQHRVEAEHEEILDRIEEALREKGYLYEDTAHLNEGL